MKTLKIHAFAAFAALSLAACDGDGGTGVIGLPQGQFEGDVSGVLDTRLLGDAESGYWTNSSYHDLIVLTDYVNDVRIAIYESEDEFREGRRAIEDEEDFDSRIVAYVEDTRTGETFGSVSGTLDLVDVRNGGIEGSARFTAESDDVPGDYVTVDVVFSTEYNGNVGIDFSRSPSPLGAKSPR